MYLLHLLGRMDLKDADTRKQTRNVRRPFGVAAYDVSEILRTNICDVDEKSFFIPFLLSVSLKIYRPSLDALPFTA